VQDETGCYNLSNVNAPGVKTGDIVHVTGLTKVTEGTSQCYLMCGRLVTIGNAPIPVPKKTTAANIVAGHGNYNPARVRGFITEAHKDELNPNWNYLALRA